jgi:hypothetical protein
MKKKYKLIIYLVARDKGNLNKNRNHQKKYFEKRLLRSQKMYFGM